jgi:hypothetical protein
MRAMARIEGKDLIFWSVPAIIACAAGVFAWRAFREPDWAPPRDQPELALLDPCARGRYRCHRGKVEMTTGDRAGGDAGPNACAWMELAPCAKGCVTERATLAGVDEATAKGQLCDLPKQPLLLLSSTQSFLDSPVAEAGICEGDGYVPTDDGFIQCIMRAPNDPTAAGVVIAKSICRAGAIKTVDRAPRLIKREEAAALWCKRDPIADTEPLDASVDAEADASADADADAKADAK